jgi:PqqD family protein of HPr-rel-A system
MDTPWRIAAPAQLSWRSWEGEIVLYNDRSGNTHHLEAVAAEAFEALLAAPADQTELAGRVAASLEIPVDGELLDVIGSIVKRLRTFDLIEPVAVN